MINLYKINKYLSLIIFFLSLISLTFLDFKNNSTQTTIICFFLISTIGISHGSLDHLKGYRVLKLFKVKIKFLFYLLYAFLAFIVIFFWMIMPLITLCIFLFVASYHFGKEDSQFDKIKKDFFTKFYFLLKGSIVILAPLWANPEETMNIFKILDVQLNIINKRIILILILFSLLSNFFIFKNITISLIDSLTVIILNLTFSPLVAFTIYFCFLHSTRHTFSLIAELSNKNFMKGFKIFLNKAIPLTLITAFLFLISIYLLTNYYLLNDSMLKVIFIGLASLTFPHILLEYIIEKYEKRT